tara:strand:+ start:418 stop:1812 length:1395 start_codon:yes stop_codon:yes gene_type:complete
MSDTTAAVAAPTGDEPTTITQRLTAAFAAADEPPAQVDNLTADQPTPEEVVADPVPEVEEPATADEPVEEPQTAEEDGDETPAEDEEAQEDGELTYPTEEELFEQLPRSVPKHVVKQMAQYAAIAKERGESLDKIGGDAFIEPLAKMVESLKSGSDDPNAYIPFLQGITEAGGDDALLEVLSHAMYVGLVKGPDWAANADTAEFGAEISQRTNAFLEMRFGLPIDKLDRFTTFDKIGWFDKIEGWIKDEYVSQAELDELIQVTADPVLTKQAEKIAELERRQEKTVEESKTATVPDSEIEQNFSEYLGNAVDHVLETVIFTDSALKDLAGDSAELKQDKAKFRSQLAQQMRLELDRHPNRSKLLSGFKKGRQQTSVYQHDLVTAVHAASTAIAKERAWAEQIVAKVYGQTRNAQLTPAKPTNGNAPQASTTPTVPKDHTPAPDGLKTKAQIQKNLEEAFAEFDA